MTERYDSRTAAVGSPFTAAAAEEQRYAPSFQLGRERFEPCLVKRSYFTKWKMKRKITPKEEQKNDIVIV